MKKIILLIVSILIVFFVCIFTMLYYDNKYNDNLNKIITKKTSIKNIKYINKYDSYYIVKNKDYIYVFDEAYKELLKIDNVLVYENKSNYDIIYIDNKIVYFNDYLKNGKLYYEYYDLYNYKLLKKIVLGG